MSDYVERELPLSEDPLDLAAALAEASSSIVGSRAHVVYERDDEWCVGLGVLVEVVVTKHEVRCSGGGGGDSVRSWVDSPLPAVDEFLRGAPVSHWRAYGWAGFEFAYLQAGMPELVGDEPLLHLFVPRIEVRLRQGRARIRAVDAEELVAVSALLAAHRPAPRKDPVSLDVAAGGAGEYRSAVGAAVDEIRARLLRKVILSRTVEVPTPVDMVGTYLAGRRGNTPTRSFLLDLGGVCATGFSPEIVVSVDADRNVGTQPLAGTRALGGGEAADLSRRDDLLSDAKEIYEHAISVKVAYDELVPLCDPGTVMVTDYMSVKPRGSVQHLASSLVGRLAPGIGSWDAFAALFPAVTASGVPKPAAYRAIRRHETGPRGLYSGAVLTMDHDGTLDAALVLRTLFRRDGRTWLQAGAGIVEQSEPGREFEETCEKLRSVAGYLVPAH
ncbi:salicylate synthase [Embleya sp. NPDC127516]|uniref:salicylate synthase n=1 Tax=Embleya sp. NPDC127516 TaxID=3363990 RepID=UPI00380F2EF8